MWKALYLPYLLIFSESYLSGGVQIEKGVVTLAAKIQTLGDALYNTMVRLPAGAGDRFLQDIKQFNSDLRQLIDLVHADKNGTRATLDSLIDRGHPKFLDTPFTNEEKKRILDSFNWTLDQLDLLYAGRVTAYTYWTDLLLLKNDNYQYDG